MRQLLKQRWASLTLLGTATGAGVRYPARTSCRGGSPRTAVVGVFYARVAANARNEALAAERKADGWESQ